MDRPTLQSLLHEADGRVQQLELNVAFQRKLMGTLNQGDHDVEAAKMSPSCLRPRRVEALAESSGRSSR